MAAFVAIGSGTAGCILAGRLADRARQGAGRGLGDVGQRRVRRADERRLRRVAGRGSSRSPAIWGFAVVADSAQFSALVSEHAPPELVGTALTLQTSLGFLLTMVTIDWLPRLAAVVGWQWAPLLLVPGPLLGIVAMRGFLRPDLKSPLTT